MSEQAGLTHEEAEAFARGLHHLANVDGIEPREEQLIREFLKESNADLSYEAVAGGVFDPMEAAQVLSTSYLRHIFLKTAIVLVRADGRYSDAEREALGHIADVFGLTNADFGALEQQAAGATLD